MPKSEKAVQEYVVVLKSAYDQSRETICESGSISFVHMPKSAGTTFTYILNAIGEYLNFQSIVIHGPPKFSELCGLQTIVPRTNAIFAGRKVFSRSLYDYGLNYVALFREPEARIISEVLYSGLRDSPEALLEVLEAGNLALGAGSNRRQYDA